MLQYLKEFGKYVEITGYRNVAFEAAEAFLKVHRKQTSQNLDLQFFDADLIATREHLYFAVLNALQAFQNRTNHSKSPAMETMLYASAQRQIQRAIETCGISPKSKNLALVIIGDDPKQIESTVEAVTQGVDSRPDERVLELTAPKKAKIKKAFQISQPEIKTAQKANNQKKAVIDLVIERVALLATQF